jgi:hypothetical protein
LKFSEGTGGVAGAIRAHPRPDRPTASADSGPMLTCTGLGDHNEGQGRCAPKLRRATVVRVHAPSRQARASVDGKRFPARQGEDGDKAKMVAPASQSGLWGSQGTLVCRPSGKYRMRELDCGYMVQMEQGS